MFFINSEGITGKADQLAATELCSAHTPKIYTNGKLLNFFVMLNENSRRKLQLIVCLYVYHE